jgi:hypothetical protein
MGAGQSATRPEPAQEPEEPEEPQRPANWWKFFLLGLISVFAVLAVYGLLTVSGGPGSTHAASASKAASPATRRTGGTPPSVAASATPAATTPSSSPSASSPASHALAVASIVAFGPDGTSDGDNPGIASRINGGGQPWYSSWYATRDFGDLQAGTGLLLDMGERVPVSSVRLVLGSQPGADVQVRVGDTAALTGLSTAATATDVGGTVRLSASVGASGRYVLVWFTALPPNGQGKYQVSVYSAAVDGTAGT